MKAHGIPAGSYEESGSAGRPAWKVAQIPEGDARELPSRRAGSRARRARLNAVDVG